MPETKISTPSQFYRGHVWQLGLALAKIFSAPIFAAFAKFFAGIYWRLATRRRKIVIQNLLPVLGDKKSAEIAARQLFAEFSIKLVDLFRFESGVPVGQWLVNWNGWEIFRAAHARGKGVLLVTPHLGNWELGGAFLVEHGFKLLVLTQPEPDEKLTALRQKTRARWGVETLVIGDGDAFAFVEIIKRLQEGATVALLIDRPPGATIVEVELFGKNFFASIAAAELARASGCAIIPAVIVRERNNYRAQILPEIIFDRAAIGNRAERVKLTQELMRAFEPVIRQYVKQWFHFVSIWPEEK